MGDGGSNELPGARAAGMEAIQAKWYTNELPHRRDSLPGFLTAEEPFDILRYFECLVGQNHLVEIAVYPTLPDDRHFFRGAVADDGQLVSRRFQAAAP